VVNVRTPTIAGENREVKLNDREKSGPTWVSEKIWSSSRDPKAAALALSHYERARGTWAAMAERAKIVYVMDISYGRVPKRRGHWADKLDGIDSSGFVQGNGVKVYKAKRNFERKDLAPGTEPQFSRGSGCWVFTLVFFWWQWCY